MPHTNWVTRSLDDIPRKEEEKNELVRFWNEFYTHLFEKTNKSEQHGKSHTVKYKDTVLEILENAKRKLPLNDVELRQIQQQIEDITILFDEKSIFKSASDIMKILIRENEECAKDYLRRRPFEKDDLELLSVFGQYTIEALIVHVLSMFFSSVESNSLIRVASLVEQLESSVRHYASLLNSGRCNKQFSSATNDFPSGNDFQVNKGRQISKLVMMYPFGSGLVQFMEERKLISLVSDLSGTVRVIKKKGSYFLPSNLYAVCNFDISLLPIKLNLPMVCKPRDWTSACRGDHNPRYLSDLSGGYLSGPTGSLYDRYRLLSSGNIDHFYIDIGRGKNYEKLCIVMNKLQGQSFKINSYWLKYLQDNENSFVEYGLLMPRFLSSLNLKDVSNLLREFHMKDEAINKLCSFSELLETLSKNIQRSRYENLIMKLAQAYDGYNFYLPAFLDFRGRIYRCGVLHFHERDLARSLIVFSDLKSQDNLNIETHFESLAFHYKSFYSFNDGIDWLSNNLSMQMGTPDVFMLAREAKRPFQFHAHLTSLMSKNMKLICGIPLTQDASASAYQIMSYFLLDATLASRTNLIPSLDGQIQDVYSYILDDLKKFMIAKMENKNLSTIVCNLLTRKLVKGIFMPMIYGKTLMSTARDLKDHLSHFITHKESYEVASVCFQFWRTQFTGMECLIRLIRHIGWIASASDRPVFYRVPYFTTVQDYMKMDPINIWVYDGLHKKRHRVTLRVSSSKRDRRKTEISTFVNFIHQRDANIAMKVVEYMLSIGAPIYTVHDNFITTAKYSHYIPVIYLKVIREMGPPLKILNEFIYMNIMKPIVKVESEGPHEGDFADKVISKEILHFYLKANVPENISKKMMATWEERILGILTSYENYTRYVCGNFQSTNARDCFRAHERKWEKFKSELSSEGNRYCVHY